MIGLVLMLVGVLLQAVCMAADPPTLTRFTVTPTTVDTSSAPATLTWCVVGTHIGSVQVSAIVPSGPQNVAPGTRSGAGCGTLILPPGAPEGVYRLCVQLWNGLEQGYLACEPSVYPDNDPPIDDLCDFGPCTVTDTPASTTTSTTLPSHVPLCARVGRDGVADGAYVRVRLHGCKHNELPVQ